MPWSGPYPPTLNRYDRYAGEVLDDVRDYVVEQLGDSAAVLTVDDSRCAPGSAENGRGGRNPPPAIAVTG